MNTLALLACLLVQNPDPAQWLDLTGGWRFRPDPASVGVQEQWFAGDFDDTAWQAVSAGLRWEEQGFAAVDGDAWYRHTFTLPDAWHDTPVWLVVNGINDSGDLYCNGALVNRFGDENVYFASVAVVADLTPHLVPGENGLALRVHDAGESGGLWRLPVGLTNTPQCFPTDSMIALHRGIEEDLLLVEVDFIGHGSMHEPVNARVRVQRPDGTQLETSAPLRAASGTVALTVPSVAPGELLRVQIEPLDREGHVVAAATIEQDFEWPAPPGWTGEAADLIVRNNFVTELYSGPTIEAQDSVGFQNPRSGWVLFAWNGQGDAPNGTIADATLRWRANPDSGASEAMRFLSQGRHTLQLESASVGTLEIRTIPELAFCYYPTKPHIGAFGEYDWPFMEKYVLPHVNVLVSRSDIDPGEFQRWRDEGRRWIYNASLPGLSGDAPSVDEVVEKWAANPAVTEDGYHGFIVDEFLFSSQAHFDAWSEGVRRIHALPAFADKTFYAWCLDLYHHMPAREFQNTLLSFGDRFVWESYLPEDPTPELAEKRFVREVTQVWSAWKKVIPGIDDRLVMCLGYLSSPPETLNLNPAVDYQVFMDMQFHALATDPAFWRLYGVMEYAASYADEESLRWAHRLFRHYCIDGNTERLTNDPYLLTHIQNPDFAGDLAGWTVEPANDNSIARDTMDGFSWLQGRYPRTKLGDAFCLFTRSAEKPNCIHQQITGLTPGRLYSVKMISADIGALDQEQQLGIHVNVDGADPLPDRSFQFAYPSNYGHLLPPYTADHPARLNFHRIVFRATTPAAELSISDWKDGAPAGPAGQRIGFNFIEVQPFRD